MAVRELEVAELDMLRGEGQYAELFVIPRIPNVIYTALLNGVPTTNDMVGQINYDNGSGTLANVLVDMTVWVGTTAGARDLGICRIRKTPTSNIFYVGELSHIEWQDNCHLTIVDDYDILPRHLKIVSGDFFIDYEEPYSNQHTVFEPVVNMGGHVLLPYSGVPVTLDRDASNSWVFGGTISSYAWTAPGSSNITGASTATPTFEWDTPGHYVIYCTATTNGGKTYRGVRYVFVVDLSELSSHLHSIKITENLDGASFSVVMTEGADLSNMNERAFVLLFSKNYFGRVVDTTIEMYEGEGGTLAVGRIMENAMSYNDEAGTVEIQVQGWKHWLAKIPVFPIGLERPLNTPSLWTDMPDLNVDRAIWHLLRYRSTVLRICDFYQSGDTRYAKELASASTNLWAQIEEITKRTILADLVFDRCGYAYLRVEPQLVPESDRSGWIVVQEIASDDWQENINVELNLHEETAQMLTSGVTVSRYGDGTPLFSMSPGHIPFPYGDMTNLEALLLSSQSQSNALAGLLIGWDNRLFDDLPIEFVGNHQMFSVAQYCRAYIEMTAESNPRGVAYTGYLCPRWIDYQWEKNSGYLHSTVHFQDESGEALNINGDIPAESGIEDFDTSFPPMPTIPIPSFTPIPLPSILTNENHPKKVVIATDQGIFYTETFNEDEPTWKAMNDGLPDADKEHTYKHLVVTPSGAMWLICGDDFNNNIYRASGFGGAWVLKGNGNTFAVAQSLDKGKILGMGVNPNSPENVCISLGLQTNLGGTKSFRLAFSSGGALSVASEWNTVGTVRMEGVVYRAGKWYLFYADNDTYLVELNTSGALIASYLLTTNGSIELQGVASGDDFVYWDRLAGGTPGFYLVDAAGGVTGINTFAPARANPQGLAMSPDGTHGMGAGASVYTPYKSTDSGASWSSVGGTIPIGSDIWENCRDNNRWLFGGGIIVRLTLDQGASYIDKDGNLDYIAPLVDVQCIRFVSD